MQCPLECAIADETVKNSSNPINNLDDLRTPFTAFALAKSSSYFATRTCLLAVGGAAQPARTYL
jgi:hypothetical protein